MNLASPTFQNNPARLRNNRHVVFKGSNFGKFGLLEFDGLFNGVRALVVKVCNYRIKHNYTSLNDIIHQLSIDLQYEEQPFIYYIKKELSLVDIVTGEVTQADIYSPIRFDNDVFFHLISAVLRYASGFKLEHRLFRDIINELLTYDSIDHVALKYWFLEYD